MKTLTVNQRINFKSNYYPESNDKYLMRINRVDHYGHYIDNSGNSHSTEIPYWNELQDGLFTTGSKFKNKF